MKFYTAEFKAGYRDYVIGFDKQRDYSEYVEGWNAARKHFMNGYNYDEDILGEYAW